MLLSIVIVNYRVPLMLEQCLHSVDKALTRLNAETEVFVVDNASGDGSLNLSRKNFPHFHYQENSENLGFAKANNQAMRSAQGKYILLLNPDTVIGETTLIEVIEAMEKDPRIGGLGVRMINAHGDFLPESKRGFPTPSASFFKLSKLYKINPSSKKMGRYYMGWLPNTQAAEIEVLAGAFMLMRKEVLDKVGLLDERFFMYGEDIDLSHRIRLGGYKCYYLPVPILHYKGESASVTDLKYLQSFYGAMQLFFDKYYSHMSRVSRGFVSLAIFLHTSLAKIIRMCRLAVGKGEEKKKPLCAYTSFDRNNIETYCSKSNLDLLVDTTEISYDELLGYMKKLSGRGHTFHLQRGRGSSIISPSR